MNRTRSGHVRWVEAPSGMLHAYSRTWAPDDSDPDHNLPACKAAIPRRSRGRASAPPVGAVMCAECSAAVGFKRRARTSLAHARRFGRASERMAAPARLALLEDAVRELRAELARLAALLP